MQPAIIALILSCITLIVGSGLLPMFLRLSRENAVRADRLQQTQDEVKKHGEEIKLNSLNHALLKQAVESLTARLGKLDLIDSIAADARFTRESIVAINSQLMPRREAESRIANVEHRIDDVENAIERRSPSITK